MDSQVVKAETPWSWSFRKGTASTTGIFLRMWLDKYGKNG